MTEFKVVSIDMFGTLVDVDSRYYNVWQIFLGEQYSDERANQIRRHAYEVLQHHYYQVTQNSRYITTRALFEEVYSDLFTELDLDFDPKEAAQILIKQHPLSTPFEDAMKFLDSVGQKYLICLSSDTDNDMIGPLKEMYAFDYVFTSEQLGSYKANIDGKFFSVIINHCGVRPEEILHIGDGRLEVVSASKTGITTCWLNRASNNWSHDVKPDYVVSSLIEAASILSIDIESE